MDPIETVVVLAALIIGVCIGSLFPNAVVAMVVILLVGFVTGILYTHAHQIDRSYDVDESDL